jgi:hypothetical protein
VRQGDGPTVDAAQATPASGNRTSSRATPTDRQVVEPTIVPEGVDADAAGATARGVHSDDWPANPRLVIGRPEGAGAKSAGFRRAARSAREGIRRCYAASTYFDRDDRHTFTVRISFARGGVTLELVGSIGDETTDACIRTALRAAAWPSLKSGSTVEIPLHLSAH